MYPIFYSAGSIAFSIMHNICSPLWARFSDRFENDKVFIKLTTLLRRAMLGELAKPDSTYAGVIKRHLAEWMIIAAERGKHILCENQRL
jgi:hypothetical protein